MSSRRIKLVPMQYEVVEYEREKSIGIYILNPELRRALGTPMVFSYDGKTWIKTAGGKAERLKDLIDVLGLDREVVEYIESYFRRVRNGA